MEKKTKHFSELLWAFINIFIYQLRMKDIDDGDVIRQLHLLAGKTKNSKCKVVKAIKV